MKARIKGTNIEIDVQPFYDEIGYFAGFKNDYEYYRAADLVFPDTPGWDKTDWSSFRREAAKDILVGICANWGKGFAGKLSETPDWAIDLADALIAKLKQE